MSRYAVGVDFGTLSGRAVLADLERLLRETPYPDRETLLRLDREFIAQNLSPGGSADQLALCWLLHFLGETPV